MPRRWSPSALAMVLAASCWLRALSLAAQARTVHLEPIDFSASTMQFSGAISNDRLPDLALLRNATNNRIANRCLQGASRHTLEAGGAAAPRLAGLVAAHIVRFASDGTCRLAFPVLVGVTRDTVVRLVQEAVPRLDSIVERIAARLAGAVGSRQGIVFHLLWSRVMDASWERAWTAAFPDHELPSVSWVVYPAHRFAVGTNYAHVPKGGDLAITWSPRFASHLAVFQGASYELYRAAWGAAVADSEVAWRLREFGALDSSAHSEVFSYKRGERLDSILTELTGEYAAVASRAYDWAALARRLDLDRGDLFVILLHETAYALFDRLHQKGRLTVPEALWGGDGVVARELASLALEGPPGPADDALAAYMKNGWRGNAEVVHGFREALARDPGNTELMWDLGLSLYDVEQYEEAIGTFERLATVTAADSARLLEHDWAWIWLGHIYDVLGERSRAVAWYQRVLDSPGRSGPLQMSQYQIGPVTAKDWARRRLAEPFARRR